MTIAITSNQAESLKAVRSAFEGESFPIVITVKNAMPRNVVFPELDALMLRPAGHEQATGTFKVVNADVLARFVSSVSQIAELNHIEGAAANVSKAESLAVKAARTAATRQKPVQVAESKE